MTDALYRHDACDTSIAAAESINVTRLEEIVLKLVQHAGDNGLTQDEALMQVCGELAYSSVTARFAGLTRKNLIHDSGKRRKGRSGRSQRVHVAGPAPSYPAETMHQNAGSPAVYVCRWNNFDDMVAGKPPDHMETV